MNNFSMKRLPILIIVVTMIAAGLIASSSSSTKIPPLTVYVPATVEWTFSGLRVQAGQELHINANGYACTSVEYGIGSTSDPGGQVESLGCGMYEDAPPPCALDYAPYGMLVGKVVSSKGETLFAIGNAETVIAPASGLLYLSVNDNLGFYDDNQGHYLAIFR